MQIEKKMLSRRRFAQLVGAGAAFAALPRPTLSIDARGQRPAFARDDAPFARAASPVVRLSSNENPYGPSPAALRAMTDAFGLSWRYPDEHQDALAEELSKLHGVSAGQVLLGDGSGEILKLAAAAFTGPGRALVVADPTFEAIAHHARTARAEVSAVRLTADYRHDLPKMLTAAGGAGLVYVCNPNNPTASLTPKTEVRDFLSKLSRETFVLVDEAYFHYVESADYESVIPLVRDYPNLVVARTFSKIYGMAGLRCGYCVAQTQTVERLRAQQPWDSVNIMALVAALASVRDPSHVEQGRRLNSEVKAHVCAELDKLGLSYIPSAANFMMIDMRREVRPLLASMRRAGVEVGRFFPSLPNHMRVTVGTREEMQAFLAALRQVTA
jgi:histidinol-phosphate aminotransferase